MFKRKTRVRTTKVVGDVRSPLIPVGFEGVVVRSEGKYTVVAFQKPYTDARGTHWPCDPCNPERDITEMKYLPDELVTI